MAIWRQNGSLQTPEFGFATKLSRRGAILNQNSALLVTESFWVDGEGEKTDSKKYPTKQNSDKLHFMILRSNLLITKLIYLSSDRFCKELITKVSYFPYVNFTSSCLKER